MPWILLLLPWLELWTLIELGAATSAPVALIWVALSMAVGVWLIRRQGEGMMRRVREQQAQGGFFGPQWLMDDLALVGSGLLLMVPGLFTDALAVCVAIGPVRRALGRALGIRAVEPGHTGFRAVVDPDRRLHERNAPLEGEYRRLDD